MLKSSLCLVSLLFLAFVNSEPTDKPDSTTAASNITTSTSLDTTTVVPTTAAPKTTTDVTTTTLMPTPAPRTEPETYDYKLTENKTVCILASFAAQVSVTYNNTDHKVETAYLNLDKNTSVNVNRSVCGKEDSERLSLNVNGNENDSLVFDFTRNGSAYYVSKITLQLQGSIIKLPLGPEEKISVTYEKELFNVDGLKSYSCKTVDPLRMEPVTDLEVKLELSDVKFDAFRDADNSNYRDAQECTADNKVDDIVPIAVGCALAALVVIVLIAYFIGRRRSRRLAYQSV